MKFKKKHVKTGDQLVYRPTLDKGYDGVKINKYGTVIKQYPHFVLVRTPYGYDTAVNNIDLYTKYGWR